MDTLYRQGFNAGKKFAQLEAQAEIDEYRNMLNRLITYTVIPDNVVKEVKNLLFNKGE